MVISLTCLCISNTTITHSLVSFYPLKHKMFDLENVVKGFAQKDTSSTYLAQDLVRKYGSKRWSCYLMKDLVWIPFKMDFKLSSPKYVKGLPTRTKVRFCVIHEDYQRKFEKFKILLSHTPLRMHAFHFIVGWMIATKEIVSHFGLSLSLASLRQISGGEPIIDLACSF